MTKGIARVFSFGFGGVLSIVLEFKSRFKCY